MGRSRFYSAGSRAAGAEPEWSARRKGDDWYAIGGLRRRRLPVAWTITRPSQQRRMGASPTAPTISQDTAIQKLPPGAITSCGIDARCPRIAGAAANTIRLAGRGDRRVERNSWRAGEAHRALRTTEFGGRCLEFGAPTAGNPGYRAGSGSAHSAAISRIRLAYVPYAREIVQRELITWLIARPEVVIRDRCHSATRKTWSRSISSCPSGPLRHLSAIREGRSSRWAPASPPPARPSTTGGA
jgi:hypothetical protein